MKSITIIRHGESTANAGGITLPHADIPLSQLGHRQAAVLAENLGVAPSAVYVSRFLRTAETAAPFCHRHGKSAEILPYLHEFSIVDPALIKGMDGAQRKPVVARYWVDPDPLRRLGPAADTFNEFETRVREFLACAYQLPDRSVVFGHGIWLGLLHWLILGYRANDASGMRAFRQFQQALPMPNCATFSLCSVTNDRWSIHADIDMAKRIASVR